MFVLFNFNVFFSGDDEVFSIISLEYGLSDEFRLFLW